ncbi:hypothetical protein PybrP1_007847 [[Pythium] brassicae (nom. inval.)]|nr:hypothetical protein PybrP1_007847 [[Pythium] brassicae (nom. inval.)]
MIAPPSPAVLESPMDTRNEPARAAFASPVVNLSSPLSPSPALSLDANCTEPVSKPSAAAPE